MNTKHITMLIITLAVAIGLTPFIVENQFISDQEFNYNTSSTVVESNDTGNLTLGIAAGEKFNFGKVSSGVNVSRNLNISARKEVLVEIGSSGNISDRLEYPDYTYVKEGSRIPVTFKAEDEGYFEGSLDVKTRVPRNEIGKKWIEIKYFFYSRY